METADPSRALFARRGVLAPRPRVPAARPRVPPARPRVPAAGNRAPAARLALLACCLAVAAGCAKGPEGVADRFVDRYYVESDQQGALPLTDGVATLRLKDELKLAAEGRTPGMDMVSRQIRVYYKRTSLSGDGEVRKADYELDIRPQGGGELRRAAHLELQRAADGTWRVIRFNETQPR